MRKTEQGSNIILVYMSILQVASGVQLVSCASVEVNARSDPEHSQLLGRIVSEGMQRHSG